MTDAKTYTHEEIRTAWAGADALDARAMERILLRAGFKPVWAKAFAAAPTIVRQLLEEVEAERAASDQLHTEGLIYLTTSRYAELSHHAREAEACRQEVARLRAELAELGQRGGALAAAAEEVLAAMEMQLARECGEAHIPQSTARHIWDAAAGATSAALKAWRGEGE